jgi:hypothetical protein
MSYRGEAEMAGKMPSNISLSKVMIIILSNKTMKNSSKQARNFCAVNVMSLIIDIKNLSRLSNKAILISKIILNSRGSTASMNMNLNP